MQKFQSLIPKSIPHSAFSPLAQQPQQPHLYSKLTLRNLIASGLHLGHKKCHKNMLQHVFGKRDNINIINLDHTLSALRRAINVVRGVAHDDGNILFVGTRLQSQRLAIKSALNSDCFYVTKWIGGMITNKDRVLARLGQTDQNKISEINALTVKEDLTGEAEILQKDSGIELPDLIILLDYKSNLWAIREANLKKIPIIALIDTDCDPRLVQYPIPGNDDAVSSVELFAGLMSLAAKEGREMKRESERKV